MELKIGAALLALVGIGSAALGIGERSLAAREVGNAKRTGASHKAVLLELFTSEGCSSCPSADVLLRDLQKQGTVEGVPIIALSEHVDYWNNGGWRDPFSSAGFSRRQNEYANAFRLDSVYTPQMVVDGKAEFVGSDEDKARNAIRRAANAPKADVTIMRAEADTPGEPASNPNAVRLRVRVENLPHLASGERADVILAITENNLRSHVGRGENAGRRLAHTAVTRLLKPIGSVKGQEPFSGAATVTVESGWKRADLSAVVFVQEHNSHKIEGAAILPLARQ